MKPADVIPTVQRLRGDWPASLVLGIIETESGRHDAKGQLVDVDARAFRIDRNGGSYGLMQLDAPTARDRGYRGEPTGLFDVPTNITFGVAQLNWIAWYLRHHGAYSRPGAIAAYNEGVANVLRGLPDTVYVARVTRAAERWRLALREGVA